MLFKAKIIGKIGALIIFYSFRQVSKVVLLKIPQKLNLKFPI